MAKKYLSLDEVTERLGMSNEQVNKLRQEGKLRGFADRGTWKFKADEIDEYARSAQVDSDPEVPIFDGGSSILGLDDLDLSGSSATIVKGSSVAYDGGGPGGSDSDVRLIFDEGATGGAGDSALDVAIRPNEGSDSDVRLSDSASGVASGGAGSDSDVRLAPETISVGEDTGSDSDVKVVDDVQTPGDFAFAGDGPADVKTAAEIDTPAEDEFDGTDTDMPVLAPGSAGSSDVVVGTGVSDADVFVADSGIALEGSSAALLPEESGIALDLDTGGADADSGIALSSDGSGVLADDDDDGLALFDDDDDASAASGINVSKPSDSGIALEGLLGGDSDVGQTVSMDALSEDEISKLDGGSKGDTELEIAALSPDEMPPEGSEFDIDVTEAGADGEGVSLSPTAAGATLEMSDVDNPAVGQSDTFEMEDNALDESFEELAADDEFGEDEDFDDDVFDASEDDFESEFTSEEGAAGFTAAPRAAAAADYDFGTPAFVGLVATSGVLAVGAMVMVDLVRSIWAYREPSVGTSAILDLVKDLF